MIVVPLRQIETFLSESTPDTHLEVQKLRGVKRIINLFHKGEVFVCSFNVHEVNGKKYPLLTKRIIE